MKRKEGMIFIVVEVDFPEGMASTACVSLMAKGLYEHKAQVCLAVMSKSFNVDGDFGIEGVYNGIPYRIFNDNNAPRGHFSYKSYKNIKDLSKLLKNRALRGFDDKVILYDNNFFKYFALLKVCRKFKIAYIPWEVEKNISMTPDKNIRGQITWWTQKISEYLVCRQADKMIVISSQLKKYFSRRLPADKIHIAPIMVDQKQYSKSIVLEKDNEVTKAFDKLKKEQIVIVYSGSFGEKDGFSFILHAFELLAKQNNKVCLVTTGKPTKYETIENVLSPIEDKAIRDRIYYLGLVSREELRYINNGADLLLVCRSNSEFANHGFPWKLGEYLMTNNPIVATRVGDVEKYLGEEHIYLAEVEASESICSKINEVLEDRNKARCKAKKAKQRAIDVFDYTKLTRLCLNFINK